MATHEPIRAIVVDRADPGRLAVRPAQLAPALPGELTIRVTAISLNRGEVRRAVNMMETGARPGWDFAGVVEHTVDYGPPVGARVVGMLASGAWAEKIHAPTNAIAVIPDGVTDAQAATLPVAGLTALHALRKGGLLLGRKVLVDGASGGVGHLAIQLAAASGARVFAHIRREEQRAAVAEWATGGIIVGPTLEAAQSAAPFHLIVDSIGGSALAAALTMLEHIGVCVTFGVSEGQAVSFDSSLFYRTGGATLHALWLFDELARNEPASEGLALLLRLIATNVLRPKIDVEAPWTQIADVARKLLDRKFAGKAVLHVTG